MELNFRLDGKLALVTGASTGIGRAIAEGLSAAGATVICASRTQSKLETVVSGIKESGGQAVAMTFDQKNLKSIRKLAYAIKNQFGQVDILVNNAGWTVTKLALDVTESEWDDTFDSSLKGLFFTCQYFGKEMVKRKSGNIINIGSNFGEVVFRTRSTYAAAKAGVHQLTKALALEWSPHGVRVNCVAPCITETPSRKEILERPGYKEWVLNDMLPIGRWAQPEDLIGAVLYLASPMSEMVTGHVLMIDGGWTIH